MPYQQHKSYVSIHECSHRVILFHINRCMSDHSDSDSTVSHPVTCVDAVTVHLHSQCSGACSDVQETAEVQS